MRPLLLKGHERSITYIRFNKDGDLLFSCAKDAQPTLWRSTNGERLGTYMGHNGAVFYLDVNDDSKLLLTASGDQTCKLWAVETGRELFTFEHKGPVKCVAWEEGDRGFATASDPFGKEIPAAIHFYALAANPSEQSSTPRLSVTVDPENPRIKTTRIAWLPLNKALVTCSEKGHMSLIDPTTGEVTARWKAHESEITSIGFNKEKSLCITASRDMTAKLWDCGASISSKEAPPEGMKMPPFKLLKTYQADTPLNGAAISPFREHVVLGGGQDAMSVTTTSADAGRFESRFHHMVFGHELARVKGHFGPINTLAFNPDGRSFASAAEDGYIRLHPLDEEYDRLGEEEEADLDDATLAAALADGSLQRLEAEEEAARQKKEAQEAATKAALAAK